MATQNIRIVGYLPPDYHHKLREFMEQQSLTESAAIVKIIKQFFAGPAEGTLSESHPILEQLHKEMSQFDRRLAILETALLANPPATQVKRSYQTSAPSMPVLSPQTRNELARRLGVTPELVVQAASRGDDHFQEWSKQLDPAGKAWHRQGNLFYPLTEYS